MSGSSVYSCSICLDQASDPVVTKCGHLFCWPCLEHWLDGRRRTFCPVCKNHIDPEVEGHVIPLYGVDGGTTPSKENASASPGAESSFSAPSAHSSSPHTSSSGKEKNHAFHRRRPAAPAYVPGASTRRQRNRFQPSWTFGGLFFAPNLSCMILCGLLWIVFYFAVPWIREHGADYLQRRRRGRQGDEHTNATHRHTSRSENERSNERAITVAGWTLAVAFMSFVFFMLIDHL